MSAQILTPQATQFALKVGAGGLTAMAVGVPPVAVGVAVVVLAGGAAAALMIAAWQHASASA